MLYETRYLSGSVHMHPYLDFDPRRPDDICARVGRDPLTESRLR